MGTMKQTKDGTMEVQGIDVEALKKELQELKEENAKLREDCKDYNDWWYEAKKKLEQARNDAQMLSELLNRFKETWR